ncbi:MAG: tetratricopeptide repeat protein [Cyclobacteriaceae bacterium]
MDSLKINEWVDQIRSNLNNVDTARAISKSLMRYSIENQHDWGEAQAYIFIGVGYHRQSSYDSANYYFDKALIINESLRDSMQIATVNLNQAMIHVNRGEFENATKKILNSLRTYERLGDNRVAKESIPRCYNNLGQVHYYQGNFGKALEYFGLFHEASRDLNDTLQIASSLTNMGAAYYEQGQFEKTMECDKQALMLHTSINNLLGMANAINNIASGYVEMGDYKQAIVYYDEAVAVYNQVPNRRGVADSYYNKGKLYLKLADYDLSERNFKDAKAISMEIKDMYQLKLIFQSLSDLSVLRGDFNVALKYFKKFHALSDSLVNESNVSKVNELEIQYETEKKQQKIDLLNKENELQATTIERNRAFSGMLVLAILLIVGAAIWIYKRFQYRSKVELEKEKARLKSEQTNAVISSQEEERKRFAMDLHDNFGQLISALRLLMNQSADIKSKSNEILDQMYVSLKEIAFDLMPQTLLQKGLVPALEELVTQLNRNGAVRFSLNTFDEGLGLPQSSQIATYRIVQELINNNLKYAKAQNVNISITALEDSVNIMLEDDGTGFNTNDLLVGSGNGWRNINSRLDLLNGKINIDSKPGSSGTTVLLNIPYSATAKEAA